MLVLKGKLPESETTKVAQGIVLSLCDVMGGGVVYFPLAKGARAEIRNQRIFADWKDGRPVEDLARDNRIALQTVYSIIAECRKAAKPEKQADKNHKSITDSQG